MARRHTNIIEDDDGSAILGWIALAICLFLAAICVFYNSIVFGSIIPTIAGQIWGTMGDGGGVPDLAQSGSIGYVSMWGRVLIPLGLIVLGVFIWYVEVVRYGRSGTG